MAHQEPTSPTSPARGTEGTAVGHIHRPAPTAHHLGFLAVDLVLVTMFAALGRRAHTEDPLGALSTAWPFLVGTLVGWFILRARHRPAGLLTSGVLIWLSTEVVGMVLRAFTGQGIAWTFVLVSLVVLGVFLVGHRALVLGLRGVRRTH